MALRFDELAEASAEVGASSSRNHKVAVLADVLRRLRPGEARAAVSFLTGTTPWGRIGVGWAALSDARAAPAAEPTLDVAEVARRLERLATTSGPGSARRRRGELSELLGVLTPREQRFLVGIVGGELRQGALEGLMVSAIARAADVPVAAVRRATMMTGDVAIAGELALDGGRTALDGAHLEPLRPVQPMLASPATDIADALGDGAEASVEWKLDGARIQAHRGGGEVRLFTRNLNDVTDRLPGVVEVVGALPGGDLVLDGEVLGLLDDGAPQRFQDTMGDLGADAVGGRGGGLRAFFFDVLYLDGDPLHDEPLATRRDALLATVPESARLPSILTADVDTATGFLDAALAAGHEGVMVKRIDRPYEAGRRGAGWRKVKPVHTLDLVVLAAEWGHGRRSGWLSNLHLGAGAGEGSGEFVMVGKTFKGLTDEMLEWQTRRFSELELGREGHVVHVRPEQVVEVAVDGVQVSRRYPGGVALRFARVRRYRDDKVAGEADTIDTVRALL